MGILAARGQPGTGSGCRLLRPGRGEAGSNGGVTVGDHPRLAVLGIGGRTVEVCDVINIPGAI